MENWNLTESDMLPFFERTPDLVCIASNDGFFKKVNQAVIDTLKYSKEELFAQPIDAFMHPQDRSKTLQERARLLQGNALVNLENRYVAKDRSIVWLNWTSVFLPDKEIVFAIAKNITERKKTELETEENYQRFRSLATNFKNKNEKERKYFAYELHEQLAQLAAVVRMDVDWINEQLPGDAQTLKNRIEHASAAAKALVTTIRRISFAVSPNMLEELGLNETMTWLCKEFSLLNGIPCYWKNTTGLERLAHEVELDFFRICQEALKNVNQHSGARSVTINLERRANDICLSICDDGKGFDAGVPYKSGLTHILDRTASINGKLQVESRVGEGTKIHVTVTPKTAALTD